MEIVQETQQSQLNPEGHKHKGYRKLWDPIHEQMEIGSDYWAIIDTPEF